MDTIENRKKTAVALVKNIRHKGERWRWLYGLNLEENVYLISSHGRIFHVHLHPREHRGNFPSYLRPTTKHPYVRALIFPRRNGVVKIVRLARVVATKFVSGSRLVYKDRNKENCRADNLRWRTRN